MEFSPKKLSKASTFQIGGLGLRQARSLFVFSISDPKQNARSLLTPVFDPAFHALLHGSLGFAVHPSFFNHFLIGQK